MPMREAAPRPRKKPSEKLNAPGGKSNAMRAIEVQRAGDDHREHGDERADPERDGERRDRIDAPVEQRDVDHARPPVMSAIDSARVSPVQM